MKEKIAFIASYTPSLLKFRLALMKEFIRLGYSVIALAPYDEMVSETLANAQIKFISIPLQRNGINPFSDIGLLIKLWKIFRKERPSILFAYTIKPIIYGSIAAKLAGISRIYSMITGTGYAFSAKNIKSRMVGFISHSLFMLALRFNTLVFFQNPDNLDFFRQKKIISSRKPVIITNGSGVDCNEFSPVTPPKDISLLMIARFLYDKGIREYVQAARMIRKRYPMIKFKLVGWIDTNPNAISQQELEEWISDGSIQYLGKLADVRDAIANSSIYVLPSYHEGTPRTVLEAMAMARPIITTNAPGCKETVIHEQNGFLVPVKSVIELYNAIEYFILSPEMIDVMGHRSRKLALEKYDVHKVNKSILQGMQIQYCEV